MTTTENKLFELRIIETGDEAPTLKRVVFELIDPSRGFHFETGQYVKLSKDGLGEGFFAIASPPEENGKLEFLVRDQEKGFAHELFKMRKGEELRTSTAMGKGFPMARLIGRDVTFVAAGSGISPVASCVRSMLKNPKQFKAVRIFYGAKTPGDFAYKKEMAKWAGEVKIFQVVSRPQGTGWKGLAGHVQDHLKGRVPAGADSIVCLSGMKGLIEEATKNLKEIGVSGENILLNY